MCVHLTVIKYGILPLLCKSFPRKGVVLISNILLTVVRTVAWQNFSHYSLHWTSLVVKVCECSVGLEWQHTFFTSSRTNKSAYDTVDNEIWKQFLRYSDRIFQKCCSGSNLPPPDMRSPCRRFWKRLRREGTKTSMFPSNEGYLRWRQKLGNRKWDLMLSNK